MDNNYNYLTWLNNILDWGAEHSSEFRDCLVDAMNISDDDFEKTFDMTKDDYIDDESDDSDDDIDLPRRVELKDVAIADCEFIDDVISERLSDEYGYCVESFRYSLNTKSKSKRGGVTTSIYDISVTDIDWDTSE